MIFILLAINTVLGGSIYFNNNLPITNTIANAGELSDYRFDFILSTGLSLGGYIRIIFPVQFSANLGLSNIEKPECSVNCVLDDRKLDFYFGHALEAGTKYAVEAFNIYNPSAQGGTANFYIQSIKGAQVIDENLKYGVMGIAKHISNLSTASVSLEATGIRNAGQLSKYLFHFTTNNRVEEPYYIRLYLPKGAFGVPQFPLCKAHPVNMNLIEGALQCKRIQGYPEWDIIDVYGAKGYLEANTERAVEVTIFNPPFQDITDNFGIALIKLNTNIIYERKLDIEGVTIDPGLMTNVSFTPIDADLTVTRNKLMWFKLSFTLSNKLEVGSILRFIFPASLKIKPINLFGRSQSVIIENGLYSESPRKLPTINYNPATNILSIKDFSLKADLDPIVIKILLATPDIPGLSSPAKITSYTSDLSGNLIDEDTTFAMITVENIPSITTHSYSLSNIYVSDATHILAKARFVFVPLITVPKNGYIHVILPGSLNTAEISPSFCYVQNSTMSIDMVQAVSCRKVNRKIIMKIGVTYFAGNAYSFELRKTLISPSASGYYFADITTYGVDGTTALESYAQDVYFSSPTLINADIELKSNEISTKSFIKLVFTAPVGILSGNYPATTSEKSSFIRLTIEPDGVFPIDKSLGFGVESGSTIPCMGFMAFESNTTKMECVLDFTSVSFIVIRGYPELAANQRAGILIPGLVNFVGSLKVSVAIVEDLNGVYTEISHFNKSIEVNSNLLPANVLDFTAAEDYYTISSHKLNQAFDVLFNLQFNERITASESLIVKLPHYGEGFCRTSNYVECRIQDISYPCFCVEGKDFILLELSQYDEIPPADVNLHLIGLQWPSTVNYIMSNVEVQVIGSNNKLKQVFSYPDFDSAEPSTFTSASLILDLFKGAPERLYRFSFTCEADVPQNGIVIIDFPDIYDLISVQPPVTVSLPEHIDSGYTYFVSKNRITISSMPFIAANTSFNIHVKGIYTPIYHTRVRNFNVSLNSEQSFLIAQFLDFAQFTLEDNFSPAEIIIGDIVVYPINADAYATYTFNIELRYNLSKGTTISIEFPDEYKVIPSEPECNVAGAIRSFERCYTSFSTISLVLDEDYNYLTADEPIIFVTIENVLNYEPGTTSPFVITTSYDGHLTGMSLNSDKTQVYITEEASGIELVDFNFDPQNEGELSLLYIKFVPLVSLNSNSEIVFIFPRIYDSALGIAIACSSTSSALRNIACKIENRVLTVYNISGYTANKANPLNLTINNIIVPNRTTSVYDHVVSYIAIATKNENSPSFLSYNKEAFTLEPLTAPKWLAISKLAPGNFKCRYPSSLQLRLKPNFAIPKTTVGGALHVQLPRQFNSVTKSLRVTSNTPAWTSATAKQSGHSLIVRGNYADFKGDLELNLFSIDNPLDETLTDSFTVKTYDGANRRIVERTYENLDPFVFEYHYPGPLIKVNGEEDIVVYRGTKSPDIPIYVENQAAFNLTLHTRLNGVMFDPDDIRINIGADVAYFKISVPHDYNPGTYELAWRLKGEKYPLIYTPIKKSKLIITDKKPLNVDIRYIDYLPFSGKSLPFLFTLEFAPDIELRINLNFKREYAGIALSTEELIFNNGELQQQFRITYSNVTLAGEEGLTFGGVDFLMHGVNADIYELPINSIDFDIVPLDTTIVQLVSLTTTTIARNSVTFRIEVDKACTLYYFVGLAGSKSLSFAEIVNKVTNQELILSRFGEFYIYPNEIDGYNFTITGLLPQHSYVMYYYLEDLGNNTRSQPYSTTFRTKDRYKSADASIRLKQTFLTEPEKAEIIKHIAALLSLSTEKIQEKKYFFDSNNKPLVDISKLSADSGTYDGGPMTTIFHFNIIPVPENEIYPSPIALGLSLNDKIQMLAARVQTLDTSYSVKSSEFPRYYPNFTVPPHVISFDHKSATFNFQLDNYGCVYLVAISSDNGPGEVDLPIGVQVSLGLDAYNIIQPSASLEIGEPDRSYNITIEGLKALTDYGIFIIAASVNPGYPELSPDDRIKTLEIKTLEPPAIDFLDLSEWIAAVSSIVAIILVFFN